jgi:hypothetical protein
VRKIEYWVEQCLECPFFEGMGTDNNICNETTIHGRQIEYPFESGWFPEWCPLEKEEFEAE